MSALLRWWRKQTRTTQIIIGTLAGTPIWCVLSVCITLLIPTTPLAPTPVPTAVAGGVGAAGRPTDVPERSPEPTDLPAPTERPTARPTATEEPSPTPQAGLTRDRDRYLTAFRAIGYTFDPERTLNDGRPSVRGSDRWASSVELIGPADAVESASINVITTEGNAERMRDLEAATRRLIAVAAPGQADAIQAWFEGEYQSIRRGEKPPSEDLEEVRADFGDVRAQILYTTPDESGFIYLLILEQP